MDKRLLAIEPDRTPWQRGMTLVELMIAMVLSSFAIAAIAMAFRSQEASSLLQETATSMQQNGGAVMAIMTRELRMAGYDPTESGSSPAAAGYATTATIASNTIAMITATSSSIRFTADLNDDGDISDSDEDIAYGFNTTDDANSDGVANSGAADLRRKTGNAAGGGLQPMAENIQAINFAYAYDADGDGDLDTTAGGNTIWAFNSGGTWFDLDSNGDGSIDALDDTDGNGVNDGVTTGTPFDINDIRAVMIWVLARSDHRDPRHTNTNTYVVGRQVITGNDGYYRRVFTTTVTCRNLGI